MEFLRKETLAHGCLALALLVGCTAMEEEDLGEVPGEDFLGEEVVDEGELEEMSPGEGFVDAESYALEGPSFGVDDIPDTCATGKRLGILSGGTVKAGVDELNDATDADAYTFATRDGVPHTMTVFARDLEGTAFVGCKVYYYSALGWILSKSDFEEGLPACYTTFTSSVDRTWCVKIYGEEGFAGPEKIATSISF